jgi:folate-binding protein YgfZ
MLALPLHEFHARHGATFTRVNDAELVAHYGDPQTEHAALRQTVAVLDLSSRGRLCVLGRDRERFLNGQVTNDVKALAPGAGCYTAVVNAKGRMEGDACVYRLAEEFLLDCEPGWATALAQRLERYVIADDVQIADAAPHFGLLSVQGPRAAEVARALAPSLEPPAQPLSLKVVAHAAWGELYVVNQPRVGVPGWEVYVPRAALEAAAETLRSAAAHLGGRLAGWEALETARIEAGIPRWGADLDESTLPPEAGLEARAISYTKGCYIGQEVLARIRTYGHVNRALCGLWLGEWQGALPARGDRLFRDGREVGHVTSATRSPGLNAAIALGYVRRECTAPGTELTLRSSEGEGPVRIVSLPFVSANTVAGPPRL